MPVLQQSVETYDNCTSLLHRTPCHKEPYHQTMAVISSTDFGVTVL